MDGGEDGGEGVAGGGFEVDEEGEGLGGGGVEDADFGVVVVIVILAGGIFGVGVVGGVVGEGGDGGEIGSGILVVEDREEGVNV